MHSGRCTGRVFYQSPKPEGGAFFLAFLPEFIDPAAGYGPLPLLIPGDTFILTGTIWCLIVVMGASAFAGAVRADPKIQRGDGLIYAGPGTAVSIMRLAHP